jgi:serine/threonine protein kinase
MAAEAEQGIERIGEYLVRRLIGEGGMGKVYEAEERLSKRRVALKVLRHELARSEEGRRLFLNEMNILSHLDHPNVVRCLACTEADGQLVMALELLEGKTLRTILSERGRLPWDEAAALALQITSALTVAHRQEPAIIHRDLKPENIMVLADGTVKVMDFGIAKVLQAISRTTTQSVGTLQYMSPEQIDAHEIDARSDLYSLGLVLYEMLSGGAPFASASPRELLNLQCTAPAPELSDEVRTGLPAGIERLVFSLLEKKPEDRPESAAKVAETLEVFRPAGGARASAAPAIKTGPVQRPAARSMPAGEGAPRAHSAMTPHRADTIGLVERATAPRELSWRVALALVLGLSAAAGIATYFARSATAVTVEAAEEAR